MNAIGNGTTEEGGAVVTDEQINLAIARAFGWHSIHTSKTGIKGMKGPLRRFMPIPNYCNCLNAMHEAEEHLRGDLWIGYVNQLADIEGSLFGIRATAKERAEVFLRVLGKWEEVQP